MTLTQFSVILITMVNGKNNKIDFSWFKTTGATLSLFVSILLLAACGYSTPVGGEAFTPYVIVVTPTIISERQTAFAQATAQIRVTSTPISTATPILTAIKTTPASMLAEKPSPTLAVSGGTYTVQVGDTLFGIAIRLKIDYNSLIKINNITDPNSIQAGQKLKLP